MNVNGHVDDAVNYSYLLFFSRTINVKCLTVEYIIKFKFHFISLILVFQLNFLRNSPAKTFEKKSNFLSNRQACVIEQRATLFRDERTLLPHLSILRTILADNNPFCSLPFYAFLLHARQ